MNKELELAVNAWYKQWTTTCDPFEDDFESELERVLPDRKFTLDIPNDYWLLIN